MAKYIVKHTERFISRLVCLKKEKITKKRFRPQAISTIIFKLIDARMNNIQKNVIRDMPMEYQSGFIKNKSTKLNIRKVMKDPSKKKVFIDFSNAYNTLKFDRVEEVLRRQIVRKTITENQIQWIMLLIQTLVYKIDNTEDNIIIPPTGVPQGMISSPSQFIIAINDFQKEHRAIAYADDIVFIQESGETFKALEKRIAKFLYDMEEIGMMVNVTKSGCTHSDTEVIVNGRTLIFKKQDYKYLGIDITKEGRLMEIKYKDLMKYIRNDKEIDARVIEELCRSKEIGSINYLQNAYNPVYLTEIRLQMESERQKKCLVAKKVHWDMNRDLLIGGRQ